MDELRERSFALPYQTHWIPLSDLMTGLMMVFLLISMIYMVQVEADSKSIREFAVRAEADSKRIREIAVLYEQMKTELYQDLNKEFEKDLPRWGAELDRDMTIRFKEPEVLFATGKDELKPRFKNILDDFFPRYVRILTSAKYRNVIQEVRIEGHTSSFWEQSASDQEAYFKNMELSQARTRSTLKYVMSLRPVTAELSWLRRYVTANGLSSSRLVFDKDGSENFTRSQRVEFRVRTDSESRIARIIESSQQ